MATVVGVGLTSVVPLPFAQLSKDDLLEMGVPPDWLQDVHGASEDRFLDLAAHLPAEAAESLLEYAATGVLQRPKPVPPQEGYSHPDALRRFRVIENLEELQQALDYPWDKWAVFLHPSQTAVVERDFAGPGRVAGSAGTGKTVVALHRAVRLAQGPDATKRVLLTTLLASARRGPGAQADGPGRPADRHRAAHHRDAAPRSRLRASSARLRPQTPGRRR